MHKLFCLHKYFIYHHVIDELLDKYLLEKELNSKDLEFKKAYTNIYLDLYYWTLYVLIEWWRDLKIKDERINILIQSKNTELLRKYRNWVFHFQKNWYDDRFENLHKEESIVNWTIELSKEFGRFFREKIKEWELIPPKIPQSIIN